MPTRAAREEAISEKELAEESVALAGAADDDRDGSEWGGFAPPQMEPAPISLDLTHLDYERLVLRDASSPGTRGRLMPADELDLAFFAQIHVQVDVLLGRVGRAQSRCAAVGQLALPSGCQPPYSVDSFDFRYDSASRVDVPSTGKWVLVPVADCRVELVPEFLCVPSVEPRVYRTLLLRNAGIQALLPGPVDVCAGDEFLLTAVLPPVPPGSNAQRLGLGVEEAIKVARKTQFKETSGGFLGGSTVLNHTIEVELNNRLATAARIEVRERVPYAPPDEKDLKVEEESVSPAWEKLEVQEGEPMNGLRRWKVNSPPGQKVVLTAQFNVRMPADKMLVGGNRRV